MSKENRYKIEDKAGRINNELDGGTIRNGIESDNSYSDKGLENAERTRQAVNKADK